MNAAQALVIQSLIEQVHHIFPPIPATGFHFLMASVDPYLEVRMSQRGNKPVTTPVLPTTADILLEKVTLSLCRVFRRLCVWPLQQRFHCRAAGFYPLPAAHTVLHETASLM